MNNCRDVLSHESPGRDCFPGMMHSGTEGKRALICLRSLKHRLFLLSFLTGIPVIVVALASPTSVERKTLFLATAPYHCQDGPRAFLMGDVRAYLSH